MQAEVGEDGVDGLGGGDEGEDAHLGAAAGAEQREDLVDAGEEAGPAGAGGGALRRVRRVGIGALARPAESAPWMRTEASRLKPPLACPGEHVGDGIMVVEEAATLEVAQEGDGAELRVGTGGRTGAPERGAAGAQQDAEHGAGEVRVVGQEGADPRRQGEHPLADGQRRQDVVGEVGGHLHHAACVAGRADAAALAGEGDPPLGGTRVAADAGEAVGEDAAPEVGAEVVLHPARHPRRGDRPRRRRPGRSRGAAARSGRGVWPSARGGG